MNDLHAHSVTARRSHLPVRRPAGEPPAEWWRWAPPLESDGRRKTAALGAGPADSALPFWALIAFLFILFIAPQNFVPVLASMRIALLAATVAIGAHLLDRFNRRQPAMIVTPETRIVTAIVGWAILTVPFSYWPGGSVNFLFEIYFKTVAIFWLLGNTVNTPARLRVVAWALTLLALPAAVTALENFASGEFIAEQRIIGYDSGFTRNPNDLALVLNLILPLAVALLLGGRTPAVRALLVAVILLLVAGVIVTFSRAGFLTLGAIVLTYLVRLVRRGHSATATALAAVALAALLLLPSGYLARLGTIMDIESDPTGSAQARWSDTRAATRFMLEHPVIGAGVGMNVLALNEARGAAWKAVHNVYLQYGVDLGLPGFVLFISLVVASLRSVRSVRKGGGAREGEARHLAEGIEIAVAAFAIAALFHPVAYHFYFYLVAGLAVATKAVYGKAGRESGD